MYKSSITLKAFKAFESEVQIRPKKINLLLGPNSSGKSSLIHFFQLLSNSQGARDSNPLIYTPSDGLRKDLISFNNIIFNHDQNRTLEFSYGDSITKKNTEMSSEQELFFKIDWKINLNKKGNVALKEFTLSKQDRTTSKYKVILNLIPKNRVDPSHPRIQGRPQYKCNRISLSALEDFILEEEIRPGLELIQNANQAKGKKTKIKLDATQCEKIIKEDFIFLLNGLSFNEIAYIDPATPGDEPRFGSIPIGVVFQFFDVFQDVFNAFVQQLDFIGPIREQIKPAYPISNAMTEGSIGYAGHKFGNFLGSKENLDRINGLLKRLEIPYQIRVERNDDIQMNIVCFENMCGIRLRPDSLGTGISQVLPVIIALATQRYGTLFIEQPELHLHPRMHEQLAELIVEEVANNSNEISLILESHSESLLKGIFYYAKKKNLSPDSIAIYCVNYDGNTSSFTQASLDSNFNINEGIDWELFPVSGFFGEL